MKKVLLIDDDSMTNFINQRILEKTGLTSEIVIAKSGRQGLQILIDGEMNGEPFPDLILLDINMPHFSGFDFLQHLMQMNFDRSLKKIVILSSSDEIEDKAKAKQLGIENYLVKPVTGDALIRLLL